jgi:UDPglucose 6-dehydrogenase
LTRLSIVGAGYVGLVSACCYAEKGYSVILREIDQRKYETIQQGKPPFREPLIDEALKRSLSSGRLVVTKDMQEAVLNSDITFVAVGTPGKMDGSIDLSQVRLAAKEIGVTLKHAEGYHHVVVRSTVVPGTTSKIVKPILQKASGKKIGEKVGLAVNPEFLREGSAVHDTYDPDRIIIGELDPKTGDFLEDFYRKFHDGKPPPILRMSSASAEMTKYASNAFLATKISFINEIANICESINNADVVQVADAIGLDTRIGSKFLEAGIGFGGSCFPKDLRALIVASKRYDYRPELLEATLSINERQALNAVRLALEEVHSLKRKQVAVLGLSFKPETDDMREARSIIVINRLLKLGAKVVAYDPVTSENARRLFHEKIEYAESVRECLRDADCCIVVTEWEEFRRLTTDDFVSLMGTPVVVDGRRIYDPRSFAKEARYRAIGLAKSKCTEES